MLSGAQIAGASTGELERLRECIDRELDERRRREREKEERRRLAQERDDERLFFAGGTYRWERRECGKKDRCEKCRSGERHGPYLYRYYRKDGRQRSEYVKLSDLPKHPEAPPRPV